jgi:hypothetical protein
VRATTNDVFTAKLAYLFPPEPATRELIGAWMNARGMGSHHCRAGISFAPVLTWEVVL